MEEPKAPKLNSESSCEIEARFTDLCKDQLSLDENTFSQALEIFSLSKNTYITNISAIGGSTLDEIERSWFAFILYSVKRLSGSTPGAAREGAVQNRISLCHILWTVKLNLVDFFKELPQFIVKVGPILGNMYGADWEKRLEAKELQANFVHLSLLSKFYKREYGVFFKTNKDDMLAKDSSYAQSANYHKFGWLLFLALRVHAFSRFKDLVTCTNGLVSILAILIIHVPTCCRKFTIEDSSCFVKRTDRGVDLLGSLCGKYETSDDEVKKMMDKANDLIVQILKKKCSAASEIKSASLFNIDPDGLSYFEDLLEDSTLTSVTYLLEKDYDDAVWNKGDIDEKVFVNEDDSLIGSGTLSGGAVSMPGTKRTFDMIASPSKTIAGPLSPCKFPKPNANSGYCCTNSEVAGTPVSTAMTTAKWLRTFISPLPSKPSANLEKFFVSCEKDVTNDIVRRAQIILEAIFPTSSPGERCITVCLQNANLMDNIWAQQRKMEALKLYYRVLEAICTAESHLLRGSNLSSLLNNERFHRCMLACSAELVLATHKTVTMLFPAVLEKTGITAFDLSKGIESFIRHEESLPRELKRHLNSLEERLLESMVWEKGSSMYNSLIVARPRLCAEINCLGLLAEPMPSLDAIAMLTHISCGSLPAAQKSDTSGPCGDIRSPKRLCNEYRSVLVERNSFTSPVKDRLMTYNNLKGKLTPPPLQSAFASPTRPSLGGTGETCAETGINIFFSKIVKLAAVRINGMVEKLQLSQQNKETVYCFFQQILNQQTSLFFHRHIDQIILCCFYGVAKISKLSLTFKEIIFNYKRLPHCKRQVFCSVFVDWSSAACRSGRTGQEHVDIITFYNKIFIPTVKPLLVELGPMGATTNTNKIPEANKTNNTPCPGSPKISSFPNLPDMSPKKVSTTHNVYVSPLRSSKKDALISHSSKSYYACVGESTHAYQSPSKDLNAINDRLNGSARKIRGARALTFDDAPAPGQVGLVSDSLVAKSLCLPQGVGGVVSSSSPAPQVKTEQLGL